MQEERKAQQDFVEKMLARESQWADERKGLINNATAAAAEPLVTKRTISEVEDVATVL